jgi:hypothetical protein
MQQACACAVILREAESQNLLCASGESALSFGKDMLAVPMASLWK